MQKSLSLNTEHPCRRMARDSCVDFITAGFLWHRLPLALRWAESSNACCQPPAQQRWWFCTACSLGSHRLFLPPQGVFTVSEALRCFIERNFTCIRRWSNTTLARMAQRVWSNVHIPYTRRCRQRLHAKKVCGVAPPQHPAFFRSAGVWVLTRYVVLQHLPTSCHFAGVSGYLLHRGKPHERHGTVFCMGGTTKFLRSRVFAQTWLCQCLKYASLCAARRSRRRVAPVSSQLFPDHRSHSNHHKAGSVAQSVLWVDSVSSSHRRTCSCLVSSRSFIRGNITGAQHAGCNTQSKVRIPHIRRCRQRLPARKVCGFAPLQHPAFLQSAVVWVLTGCVVLQCLPTS